MAAALGPGGIVLPRIIEFEQLPSFVFVVACEADALTGREEGHGSEAHSVALDGERVEVRHQVPLAGELLEGDVDSFTAGIGPASMLQARAGGQVGRPWVGGFHPVGALLVFPDPVEVIGYPRPGRRSQG